MAARTAKGGKADWSTAGPTGPWTNIPEVRVWRLTPRSAPTVYASSSTAGARKRLEGIDDFDLTISLYIDENTRFDTDLGITEGATGWFRLWEDAVNFYVAPSYIDEVPVAVDIEGGGIVEGSIAASSNGTLVRPA